jgi:hypothetical protein
MKSARVLIASERLVLKLISCLLICRLDFAGSTRKIKIFAQEFSLKLGAPNPRSTPDEAGRSRLPSNTPVKEMSYG